MVESLADLGHSMLNEDKFTSRHNITSDATCFQLRQTLDILRQHIDMKYVRKILLNRGVLQQQGSIRRIGRSV